MVKPAATLPVGVLRRATTAGGPRHELSVRAKILSIAGSIFVAAFAVTAWVAWREYSELVSLRAAALAGDERAALEARLADFKRRNYDLQAQLAALQAGRIADDAT